MIRNFLSKLMYGRYGNDQLNTFLLVLFWIFYILSFVTGEGVISLLGTFCLILSIIRVFSKQIDRRRAENAKFLQMIRPVRQWFKLMRTRAKDKDHCYFKCPNCKQHLRVPKGKGKITITCRACGKSFTEKT